MIVKVSVFFLTFRIEKVYDVAEEEHNIEQPFTNFIGKHLVLGFVFDKVAGMKACDFIKKRLQRRSFSVNFAKLPIGKNNPLNRLSREKMD